MVSFRQKAGIVILCLMLIAALSACSSNSSNSNSGEKASESTGSSQQSVAALSFEMYKKINLGMTKDQVNSALGTAPIAETGSMAVPGTFNYRDKNGNYGVTVIYNDKNILYSKTVAYKSAKDLVPMTPKPVSQEQAKSINKGMTNEEVAKILGGEGVECSATAVLNDINKVGVIKRWGNKDGSSIQVVFTDEGKVGNSMFFSARD